MRHGWAAQTKPGCGRCRRGLYGHAIVWDRLEKSHVAFEVGQRVRRLKPEFWSSGAKYAMSAQSVLHC
jgi:hypothetical protein